MLRIILGRAGSGKTHSCLDEICRELRQDPVGAPLLLVVPQESTFAMEQELFRKSGLQAISRAEVLGFHRLRWRVLQNTGGGLEPPLRDQGRKFLLASVAQKYRDDLVIFGDVAHHPGFLDKLNRVMVELMQSSSDLGSDQSWSTNIPNPGHSIVDAKAHDLALLWRGYRAELDRRGLLDDSWGWAEAAAQIGQTDLLEGAQVWIDGFQGFAKHELALLASMLQKAEQVTVTLRLDPAIFSDTDLNPKFGQIATLANGNVFAYSVGTLEALMDLAWDLAIPYTIDTCPSGRLYGVTNAPKYQGALEPVGLYRFRDSPALAHLEDQLRVPTLNPTPLDGPVESIAIAPVANYRDEVRAVARFLVGQARDHNVRWKHMVVATSDLAAYGELLADVFNSWGIPFFLDQPQTVGWHPLVVFLVGLLDMISTEWSTQAVMQVLKSDLIGGGRAWVDTLENYVLANGIDGDLWFDDRVWDKIRKNLGLESSEISVQIDAMRSMRAFYEQVAPSLEEPVMGRHLMLHLWDLLEDLGIPERLDYWMHEEAAEVDAPGRALKEYGMPQMNPVMDHVGVWNLWVGLVDEFIQILGDVTLTWSEFASLIEDGLGNLALTKIPLGLDQVIVTVPSRLVNSEVRVLAVMGADEKHLRFGNVEDVIVNDGERITLGKHNWPLEPQRRIQTQREPMFWYSLFTRAKDSLFITYSLADPEGRSQEPAPIIKDLYRVFPELAGSHVNADMGANMALRSPLGPSSISDAADFTASALGLWREGLRGKVHFDSHEASEILCMYNWLVDLDEGQRALERRLGGLHYNNEALPLRRSTMQRIFGGELKTNVHHLEAMAECPFRHFASGILRLQERDLLTWDARLEGILWHEALAKLIQYLQLTGQDLGELEEVETKAIAGAIWQDAIGDLTEGFAQSLGSYGYRVRRLERAFQRVVGVLAEHARRGEFRPIAAEVVFGMAGKSAWHIPRPDGSSMHLRGRIDCIEAATVGGILYVRVLDFKSGTRKLDFRDVYHGFALQLLAYLGFLADTSCDLLAMAAESGPPAQSVVLAGALYLPLHEPFVSVDRPLDPEALAKELLAKYKMQGVILHDEQVIDLMERDLSGWSSLLPLGRKKDGTLYKDSSVYAQEDMDVLTSYVKQRIGELGDQILRGAIDIAPFRTTDARACKYCPYTALCRFELGVLGCGYRYIPSLSSAEALGLMTQAVAGKQSNGKMVGGVRRG